MARIGVTGKQTISGDSEGSTARLSFADLKMAERGEHGRLQRREPVNKVLPGNLVNRRLRFRTDPEKDIKPLKLRALSR